MVAKSPDIPQSKRPRTSPDAISCASPLLQLEQFFLSSSQCNERPSLPQSLRAKPSAKVRQSLNAFKELWDSHGFRTSIVRSPRPALSIYKDSCPSSTHFRSPEPFATDGQSVLTALLGLHHEQASLETCYKQNVLHRFCYRQFCQLLSNKGLTANTLANEGVSQLLRWWEQLEDEQVTSMESIEVWVRIVMIPAIVKQEPRLRVDQLEKEYFRLTCYYSTLSNALLQLVFWEEHECIWKEAQYRASPEQPHFERITVYLYHEDLDEGKRPSRFAFLPELNRALRGTTGLIAESMIQTFWSHLFLQGGYFASPTLKTELQSCLHRFFCSGIHPNPRVPMKLNAHFSPTKPLSVYLHGLPGSGKSSWVRNVPASLQVAVQTHADPEVLVQFVKQNCNKPLKTMQLELDLRPNNNDLSVMSLIQSRRLTRRQTKPGLVVIGLEEIPPESSQISSNNDNPSQLETCQLISQRFGGRKGQYDANRQIVRNSDTRGIGGDLSLITLLTSNYALGPDAQDALERLPMFNDMTCVHMKAIQGSDCQIFAETCLQHCMIQQYQMQLDRDPLPCFFSKLSLKIPAMVQAIEATNDLRPLVKHLRMLAYYIVSCGKQKDKGNPSAPWKISVHQQSGSGTTHNMTIELQTDECAMVLQQGAMGILYPIGRPSSLAASTGVHSVESRIWETLSRWYVQQYSQENGGTCQLNVVELSTMFNFWITNTLPPTVVVTRDKDTAAALMDLVAMITNELHIESSTIPSIDASTTKMMKSLYDPTDSSSTNLRDEIQKRQLSDTSSSFGARSLVSVELHCLNVDSQFCIREMVEDSPSLTAFSSFQSALIKRGLLFVIYVADEITPELRSRASLII